MSSLQLHYSLNIAGGNQPSAALLACGQQGRQMVSTEFKLRSDDRGHISLCLHDANVEGLSASMSVHNLKVNISPLKLAGVMTAFSKSYFTVERPL